LFFYSLEFPYPVLVCLLDCLCFVFLFFYSCKKKYEKQNLKSDQGYRRFLFSFIFKRKKIPQRGGNLECHWNTKWTEEGIIIKQPREHEINFSEYNTYIAHSPSPVWGGKGDGAWP
jgi:hypothetical protein